MENDADNITLSTDLILSGYNLCMVVVVLYDVVFFSFAIGAKYALASDACIRAKVSVQCSCLKLTTFNGESY